MRTMESSFPGQSTKKSPRVNGSWTYFNLWRGFLIFPGPIGSSHRALSICFLEHTRLNVCGGK